MKVTYIDSQVEQIERARVWLIPFLARSEMWSSIRLRRDVKLPRRQHGHQDVCQVQQNRTEYLLRRIEEPDLDRAAWVLPPSLDRQRRDCEQSKRTLY